MNKGRTRKIIFLLMALMVLLIIGTDAWAQCAMCKASAANLDAPSARQLNLATLILLCPPVAIFCALFVVAYKHRHPPDEDS